MNWLVGVIILFFCGVAMYAVCENMDDKSPGKDILVGIIATVAIIVIAGIFFSAS